MSSALIHTAAGIFMFKMVMISMQKTMLFSGQSRKGGVGTNIREI